MVSIIIPSRRGGVRLGTVSFPISGGGGGTDWDNVSIGDYVEGGVYAGIITYSDARQFRLISAIQSGEIALIKWQESSGSNVGTAVDMDDGVANMQMFLDTDIDRFLAAKHCHDYSSGGFDDFYLGAANELLVVSGLYDIGHPEFQVSPTDPRWSSTEVGSSAYWNRWTQDALFTAGKNNQFRVRPIRRIPV